MTGWRALFFSCALLGCGAVRTEPEQRGVMASPGPCGRGLVVVESDYQSSNVSALDFQGQVLSASLASSSTEGSGFGLALSGDVVASDTPPSAARIALLDRYPAGVLRFIDLATGQVSAELSVATGFPANPQDYLALSEHRAYVSRYTSNPNPGRQAWDAGADVLIVDPSLPTVTGRIDLAPAMQGEAAQFSAHPSRLLSASGRVFVLLASYADDYMSGTSSRLVELDPESDTLVSTLVLDGLRGCDSLALSPDGKQLAVACTGDDLRGMPPSITHSGLALVDISGEAALAQRFEASTWGSAPLGFALDYAAPGLILVGSFGYFEESGAVGALDSVLRVDTATGAAQTLLRSQTQPFTLGAVRCASACGACFIADAERSGGSVLRFAVDETGALGTPEAIRVETRVGLPPRYLSVF